MANPELRSQKLQPPTPKNAFTDQDKENLKQHVKTYAHHRQKRFFTKKTVEWGQLHAKKKK